MSIGVFAGVGGDVEVPNIGYKEYSAVQGMGSCAADWLLHEKREVGSGSNFDHGFNSRSRLDRCSRLLHGVGEDHLVHEEGRKID